jgi:hypothetical protein
VVPGRGADKTNRRPHGPEPAMQRDGLRLRRDAEFEAQGLAQCAIL